MEYEFLKQSYPGTPQPPTDRSPFANPEQRDRAAMRYLGEIGASMLPWPKEVS